MSSIQKKCYIYYVSNKTTRVLGSMTIYYEKNVSTYNFIAFNQHYKIGAGKTS